MLTYTVPSVSAFDMLSEDNSPADAGPPAVADSICRSSAAVNVPGTFSLGLRCAEFVRNGGVGLNAGEEADEP